MPTKTKTPPKPAARVTAASTPATPMPTLTPEGLTAAAPGSGAGLLGAQAEAQAVAAVQSVTIGGLWTSNNQSNAYAYLNGIGWRHVSAANPVSHHAMLQILRLARDANLTAQCDEDGTNIHNVYVW